MTDIPDRDPVTGRTTTGHEWDGIRELNNPLPKWWVYTFIVTILVAVGYCVLFPAIPWLHGHTTGTLGYTARGRLDQDLSAANEAQAGMRARIAAASLEDIRRNPDLLAFAQTGGKAAFAENCAACHRAGGAGAKGFPNLADDDWLWGGKLSDIQQTVIHGIRNTDPDSRQSAMPRFGLDGMLTSGQISAVADYVLSLSTGKPLPGEGAKIFADNCVTCHGDKGQGSRDVGAPRLSDNIWLYGGDRTTVVDVITRARNSSMPAWSTRLDPVTIKMLTVYVHALGGGE
ncbi:MAG: cytochrome-c oxidase, cbb3-type subunit III [Alphaproteobacteria bacterium]|nr:cytochrome-c oxidase, cbb3-type subunit III [Alphaproteobacteria bacterium]